MQDVNAVKNLDVLADFPGTDTAPLEPLLRHCSTADLLIEAPYRRYKLAKERRLKLLRLIVTAGIAAAIFCAGLWYWRRDGITDLAVVLTVFGFMLGVASLKRHDMPTEVEEMQLYALREIDWLLRERGLR